MWIRSQLILSKWSKNCFFVDGLELLSTMQKLAWDYCKHFRHSWLTTNCLVGIDLLFLWTFCRYYSDISNMPRLNPKDLSAFLDEQSFVSCVSFFLEEDHKVVCVFCLINIMFLKTSVRYETCVGSTTALTGNLLISYTVCSVMKRAPSGNRMLLCVDYSYLSINCRHDRKTFRCFFSDTLVRFQYTKRADPDLRLRREVRGSNPRDSWLQSWSAPAALARATWKRVHANERLHSTLVDELRPVKSELLLKAGK